MTTFTVEAVMKPVVDGDWTNLREATDQLPGTILIEDPDEPMLIIPVDADSQRSAALFVQGAMTVLGLEIVWGRAYRTERCSVAYHDDCGESAEDDREPTGVDFAPDWLEDLATTERARQLVEA